ncbi:hypothetical protein FSB78_01535 [Sphingomonas ginsenosidivorax]|uniref:Uncharacterized protein n=1 Tax=Sphingomonas ginsenosidivorax TaxID=862135 RepID=A0A5C6UA15_9SPHN|nr:hypothetical protein [Sphingomonas ginsenosidivorax]TXC69783.1 hypothetical protein FSB78_01535 [Sphingomonas ginsenosidivorax]
MRVYDDLQLGSAVASGAEGSMPFAITDADGYALLAMDLRRRWHMAGALFAGDLEMAAGTIVSDQPASSPWSVTDEDGHAYAALVDGDIAFMHAGSSADLGMLYKDARNRARTASIMGAPHNLQVATLDATRALILLYSQSLGNGQEAHPAVTMAPLSPSAFMIGLSVRPGWFYGPGWFPRDGDATLHPLKATVELGINDPSPTDHVRRPLTAQEIAALDPHDPAEGESPVVAIANRVARQWDDAGYRPARKIIAMACGVGGRTLEPLYPLEIKRVGRAIYVHHHLPCGPLPIKPLCDGAASTLYDDAGYRVVDAQGDVPIKSVTIIGSTIAKILCARVPGEGAELLYADKARHNGGGNIFDSDPARSDSVSTRTGLPYDLSNACSPYRLAIGWKRPVMEQQ